MPIKRATIRGPFHGIMTDVAPTLDELGFEDVVNFITWKGRLRIRPGLDLPNKAKPPNGEFPLNMCSFQDAEQFLHTLILTNNNPYMLTAGFVYNLLDYPVYIKSLALDNPGSGYTAQDTLNIIQLGSDSGSARVISVTGTGDITAAVLNNSGLGYTAGDVLTVVQVGASGGQCVVTSTGALGAITALALSTGGDDYTTATGAGVTGGTGSGATVDITANPFGIIDQIELDNPGNGYTTATGLATSGGTGTGATVDIVGTSLTSLGGSTSTGLPYALVKAQNKVFFCNGSVPLLFADGEASIKVAGNVPGACRYLTANANHLIGAYWTEPDPTQSGSTVFPQRVRWSDSNNFFEWGVADPAFSSGLTDLVNTPDNITGLSTLGTYSYVYRNNGISIMQPTGIASIPFYIPNYSIAPKGEGNAYPYSLATYNNIDRFIGNFDVFSFDGSNFTSLMDKKCNAEFFNDLKSATGVSQVRGIMCSILDNGYTYLAYLITIPGANVSWIMNVSDGYWTRLSWLPNGLVGYSDLQLIEQVYLS